jgi:hypothetical protein
VLKVRFKERLELKVLKEDKELKGLKVQFKVHKAHKEL